MKAALSIIVLLAVASWTTRAHAQPSGRDIPYPLYGITVDDSWRGPERLAEIVAAIQAMSVKPTVRIVMSERIPPTDYKETFKAIHNVAYVLAQPVDSYYMKRFTTVDSYLKRFEDSYRELAPFVDMWEIANEINGEGWLGGDRQFNADKMYAAYKYIHSKGGKTVLISYEVAPGDQEMSMLDWLRTYVPKDMKEHLDYLMVSYYEDDHRDYQPDWKSTFESLEEIFPNSIFAIGECGNTAKTATAESKMKMAEHYYLMPKYTNKYVGGYFWWTWVQDCVPHTNNPVWRKIDDSCKASFK